MKFDRLFAVFKKNNEKGYFAPFGKGLGKLEMGLIGCVLFFVCLFCFMPFLPARPFSQESIVFEVESGQGVRSLAGHLKEEGLINSAFAFTLASRLTGKDRTIKAGVYDLSPGMTVMDIIELLEGGQSDSIRLTIPEGYSLRQIAREIERQGLGKPERFLDFAHAYLYVERFPWLKGLSEEATLEGYLFPDTYYLGPGSTESQVVELMLKRFQQLVLPTWKKAKKGSLDFHRVITLASIVELEAKIPSERPLIAGVFFNRLRTAMPLGSDPTVEYALGRHQSQKGLSLADIRIASPYNTYRYSGLPPGPIANPGLASIKAVLAPQETPYLYFVAKGNGTHRFSRTLAEQIQAQRNYQGSMLRSNP
ncbi:MAG TPA: endolytic transglycosylase MltG [Cyanobacteria bacterium UBA8530]|nr:endolytic transglycosylase MltG [Cyanobacteria bacterium UBA8530]